MSTKAIAKIEVEFNLEEGLSCMKKDAVNNLTDWLGKMTVGMFGSVSMNCTVNDVKITIPFQDSKGR